MLSVLDAHMDISFLCGENVLEIGKLESSNRMVVIQELHNRGWACVLVELQALDYGSIASRPRIFVFGAHKERLGWSQDVAATFLDRLQKVVKSLALKRGTFEEKDFLLPDSHHLIKQELSSLKAKEVKQPEKDVNWPGKLADLLRSMNRTWSDCALPPSLRTNEWVCASLSPRERMGLGDQMNSNSHTAIQDSIQDIRFKNLDTDSRPAPRFAF